MLLSFIAAQFVLTTAFGVYIAQGSPDPWVMAALLFSASLFFNALQPIGHALVADIAEPEHHARRSACTTWSARWPRSSRRR